MAVNRPDDKPLYFHQLPKENAMPENHHSDPANSSVKPGFKSSEGQIALLVVVVTALGPILAMFAEKFPQDWRVQLAVAILGAITITLTGLGYMKSRGEVKTTANVAAASLALADKAIAIAKDHPELARELLKSAGVSVPTPPASS